MAKNPKVPKTKGGGKLPQGRVRNIKSGSPLGRPVGSKQK